MLLPGCSPGRREECNKRLLPVVPPPAYPSLPCTGFADPREHLGEELCELDVPASLVSLNALWHCKPCVPSPRDVPASLVSL